MKIVNEVSRLVEVQLMQSPVYRQMPTQNFEVVSIAHNSGSKSLNRTTVMIERIVIYLRAERGICNPYDNQQ